MTLRSMMARDSSSCSLAHRCSMSCGLGWPRPCAPSTGSAVQSEMVARTRCREGLRITTLQSGRWRDSHGSEKIRSCTGADRPTKAAGSVACAPAPLHTCLVQRRSTAVATFLKTTQIPVAGAHALPGRYFTSTEIFALESERVFGRRWLCVGREAQLAEPGDYVVQQVGTESVIILRDDTRALRAFHNVCRHRGTRLCTAPAGQLSETIQCPYHALTWRLDGRLH